MDEQIADRQWDQRIAASHEANRAYRQAYSDAANSEFGQKLELSSARAKAFHLERAYEELAVTHNQLTDVIVATFEYLKSASMVPDNGVSESLAAFIDQNKAVADVLGHVPLHPWMIDINQFNDAAPEDADTVAASDEDGISAVSEVPA
jgi:hypothetical protein